MLQRTLTKAEHPFDACFAYPFVLHKKDLGSLDNVIKVFGLISALSLLPTLVASNPYQFSHVP